MTVKIPLATAILTYFGYGFLVFVGSISAFFLHYSWSGHVRDFFSSFRKKENYEPVS